MRSTLLAMIAAMASCCGCAQNTERVVPPPRLTTAQQNFEALWQGSLNVLEDYYFALQRTDRREGVILTEPLTGKHWFEFWRKDSASAFDTAESTLQTIYRQVRVTIRPTAPGAATYQASVEVLVSRLDRDLPEITSTSEAYGHFLLPGYEFERNRHNKSAIIESKLMAEHLQPKNLVQLGRDAKLEAKLSADIRMMAMKKSAELDAQSR